ncbi:neuropilin-1-like [Halichondria panicea]|uniref:neuropilin-1-like n=1 Tax=Halichondria panicea TaxID=6063 RepID=UPI00312B73F4
MTSKAVWVMLVCILQTSQVLCQGNACQEPQALITGEMYRVEDEQFTASSSFSENYLPHEARLEGNSWCAQAGLGSGAWIQVDFKTYVIIQELQIGGDRGGFYINQFTIEHGPNSDQLNSILQANSNQPMVFTRLNSPSVSTTVLPTPLTTRVLRIVSVVHSGSDPCLYLEAIGCVQSPDTTQTTPTNETETDDAMTTTMLVSAGNTGAIVGGSVGGATFVLVILLITIIILVVCLQVKRRNIRTEATPGSSTEKKCSEETRSPNTLENMGEVYSEPMAIAYKPITMTTLNRSNTYESINISDLEYAQVDTTKGGYSNTEERDGDMTQNNAYGRLVENGATSLPEAENEYELV